LSLKWYCTNIVLPPKIMSNLFFSNTHSHKMYSSNIYSFIHPTSIHPSIHLFTHSSNIYSFIHPSIHSSIHPFIQHPSIHSFTHSSIHPSILWTNLSNLSLLLFLIRNRPSFTISKTHNHKPKYFSCKFCSNLDTWVFFHFFALFSSLMFCWVDIWVFKN
jgi:hypothetical protein